MATFNTDKLLKTMFQKVDTVVYDLMSGTTAVRTADGLISYQDGELVQNPLDGFAMELPAFATLTQIKDLSEGDLIIVDGKPKGFVLDTDADNTVVDLLDVSGQEASYRPRTVKFLGQSAGVLVVKSLFSMTNGGSTEAMNPLMLMALMGDGKKDMSSMLPFMLLGNSAGGSMNPLMLMALMGDKNPFA